ncbi:MAG: hypothetical protein ACKOLA_02505 [Spartobacteria bacterium]
MNKQNTTHNNPSYIGIDFHKRYSVFCAIDSADRILERGRIDHSTPQLFIDLVKRHPGCRVVFETTMNWAWLYELLEPHIAQKTLYRLWKSIPI